MDVLNTKAKSVQYRPQLDSLRCIAVLMVFFSHSMFDTYLKEDPWGTIGVKLFFVLSGFLITRIILLNECPTFLTAFYARRVLRIFPIYYLVLAILFSLGRLLYPEWCISYLFNIRCLFPGYYGSKVDHFWSLAVEEQFYLLFPAVLLACSKPLRPYLIVALILGCIIFRALAGNFIHSTFTERLLPICGEFLLWGALAGYIDTKIRPGKTNGTLIFGLGCVGCIVVFILRHATSVFHNPIQTLTGVSIALIVFGIWRTSDKLLLKAFTVPPIVYLGKISYGFYIIHYFCFDLRRFAVYKLPALASIHPIALDFIFAFALASLSWHFFEEPINNLKSKFPYRGKQRDAMEPVSQMLESTPDENEAKPALTGTYPT